MFRRVIIYLCEYATARTDVAVTEKERMFLFEKHKLKKEIERCKSRLAEIERKRYRSQGELVNAILCNQEPSQDEVEYFNRYTMEINETRERMHKYEADLAAMKK